MIFQGSKVLEIQAGHRKEGLGTTANPIKKALALLLCGSLALMGIPRATAQTGVLEGGAVIVGVIYVAGVAAYYVLQNNRGQQWTVPIPQSGFPDRQPQVRPGPRPSRIEYNEPGKQEVHAVASPQKCREMAERFKLQGRNLKLKKIMRTPTPGLRYDCIFEGPDAQEGWFVDRRGR